MNVFLRPARSTDAGKIGAILTEANATPDWKPNLHTGAEDVAFCGRLIDRGWVRVAENEAGEVVGWIARDGNEVDVLYVRADARSQGVGKVLLQDAMQNTDRLELWTFQKNTGAQKFYEREGFKVVKKTDGSTNDEKLPDVRYVWEKK